MTTNQLEFDENDTRELQYLAQGLSGGMTPPEQLPHGQYVGQYTEHYLARWDAMRRLLRSAHDAMAELGDEDAYALTVVFQ